MKLLILLAAVALGVFLVIRQRPVPPPVTVAAAPASAVQGAATPTALRRPIARTQETLELVKQRNGTGDF